MSLYRRFLLMVACFTAWVLSPFISADTVYLKNGAWIDGIVRARNEKVVEIEIGKIGDLSSRIAFTLAKDRKENPAKIASELAEKINKTQTSKPGTSATQNSTGNFEKIEANVTLDDSRFKQPAVRQEGGKSK